MTDFKYVILPSHGDSKLTTEKDSKVSRRLFLGSVAAAAAVGVVAGAGGYYALQQTKPPPPVSTGPIKLGWIGYLTGSFGLFGVAFKKGLDLWVEDTNNNGGLLGRQIQSIIYDDATDFTKDSALTEKLITVDNVDLILGPGGSGGSAAEFPVWYRYKFPVVDYSSVAEEFTSESAKEGYVYTVYIPGIAWAISFLEFMSKQNPPPTKVAYVVYSDPAFSVAADYMDRNAKSKYGMDIVYKTVYEPGMTDFTPIASSLKAAGAEAMLYVGTYPDAASLVRAMAAVNYQPKFPPALQSGPDDISFWSGLGKTGLNCLILNDCGAVYEALATKVPLVATWVQKWKAKYNEDPAGHCFGTLTEAYVLAAAVNKAGSLDHEKIHAALQTLKLDVTPLGFAFDPSQGPPYNVDQPDGHHYGENNGIPCPVSQYVGGDKKYEILYPSNIATTTTIAPWPAP